MKDLALQTYLKTKGLDALQAAFGIKVRRHDQLGNLVCFKYSQYESPMDEIVVQQCRGIILDEANDWAVVSYPYDKFFNYGEGNAATIDWDAATVQDKLDGSLMTLYFYDGQWQVQSSGTPDASGDVSGYKMTFAELLWQTWKQLNYDLPHGYEDYCFMFELETPYNRIVVQHSEHSLILHGVRNVKTYREASPAVWADKMGWQAVNSYAFGTIEALVAQAEQLDPLQQEGFIVCDASFNRIKLKSSEYVKLSHMKDGSSYRKLLSVVVNNESAEFLAYFQELQSLFDEITEQYAELVSFVEQEYDKYKDIETQKDFAMSVKDFPYSGALFALRAGKVSSVRDYMAGIAVTKVEQYLEALV
ncbi:MAG: T4 RnlA family RNA ligase [Cyanobacteria bacterium P01_C01_bin.69]